MSDDANEKLPQIGYVRQRQLMPIMPFSRTTLWRMVKEGSFPAPVKLSTKITAWRAEDIHAWLHEQGKALPPLPPTRERPALPPTASAEQLSRPARNRKDEKRLLLEAEAWRQATTLRAYAVHISSMIVDRGTPATPDESEWLRWAKSVADNLDPTAARVSIT